MTLTKSESLAINRTDRIIDTAQLPLSRFPSFVYFTSLMSPADCAINPMHQDIDLLFCRNNDS